MRSWIKQNGRWLLLAVAMAGGAWLFFGFFAFHTLLIDEEVNEPLPFFVAGPAPSGMQGDAMTQERADAMNKAIEESDMPMVVEVNEPMPPPMADPGTTSTEDNPSEQGIDKAAASSADTSEPASPPVDNEPPPVDNEPQAVDNEPPPVDNEPPPVTEASGSFVSRSHPTEGNVLVLGDGSGRRFLRLEDFRTDNGPDLNVYLSSAPVDAPAGDFDDDFVDLGDLKGNVGAQNYEIPSDVDLEHYSTVTVWCVRFGVVFGAAALTSS